MAEPMSTGAGAARLVPALGRLAPTALRVALRLPWWGLAVVAAVGGIVVWTGLQLAGAVGAGPGAVIVASVAVAAGHRAWCLRPARGRFVVYVSEFSESSTHAHVRAGRVHRDQLIAKLAQDPDLEPVIEVRRLPAVPIVTAERLLAQSPGWAIVRGEIVTAGDTVKWTASMAFRVLSHSRYAVSVDDGRPAFIAGPQSWAPPHRIRLSTDAGQSISVLTQEDFPASHAEGALATVLALTAAKHPTVGEAQRATRAVRRRWAHAPTAAKALVALCEADIELQTKGYKPARRALSKALNDGEAHELLQRGYASTVTLGCAHGEYRPQTWLRATELPAIAESSDPDLVYMRGCALMAGGRWEEAAVALQQVAGMRYRGTLLPPRPEVLSALVQATLLAGADEEQFKRVLSRFRRSFRSWRRGFRMPDDDTAQQLAWAWRHSYDKLAAPVMRRRLDEFEREGFSA